MQIELGEYGLYMYIFGKVFKDSLKIYVHVLKKKLYVYICCNLKTLQHT